MQIVGKINWSYPFFFKLCPCPIFKVRNNFLIALLELYKQPKDLLTFFYANKLIFFLSLYALLKNNYSRYS